MYTILLHSDAKRWVDHGYTVVVDRNQYSERLGSLVVTPTQILVYLRGVYEEQLQGEYTLDIRAQELVQMLEFLLLPATMCMVEERPGIRLVHTPDPESELYELLSVCFPARGTADKWVCIGANIKAMLAAARYAAEQTHQ